MKHLLNIVCCLIFLIFPTLAQAQVVISEVYPAPISGESEWIELYNSSKTAVDISEWKIFEHFANKNEITTFHNILLEPNQFFVFELKTNKLNNSEEKVSLVSDQNETTNEFYYLNSKSQKSFSRLFINEFLIGEDIEITDSSKGIINPLVQENNTEIVKIEIIEANACPDDNQVETITLKNTSLINILLTDWELTDISGNKISLKDITLEKNEIYILELENSILNNSGDTLILRNPNNEIISELVINGCQEKVVETEKTTNIDNSEKKQEKTIKKQTVTQSKTGQSELENFIKIHNALKTPNLQRTKHKDLIQTEKKLSYLVQKKVSKEGVLDVIIGGSLLILTGFIL